MKKWIHILLVLAGLSMTILAFRVSQIVDRLQVRIFSHLKIGMLQVYAPVAGYRLMGDGEAITQILAGINYRFTQEGDKIQVMENQRVLGRYTYIKLVGNGTGELKIRLLDPDKKLRTYADNISMGVNEGGIRLINEVQLDNYIAGVTDAEAGTRCSLEFYKVQAILARTFALAHINKHVSEGFSLCDLVHCQAYHGKPRDLNVTKAVEATRGLVVVDQNLDLIIAAFHSNSGGQTANSEDVWGGRTSYLRSISDTFSTRMPNFAWERRMLAEDWLSYLKLKHNFPVETDSGRNIALTFTQDSRKAYLQCSTTKVPLKNVREDLQLRSTFFSISKLGSDSVLFTGRGYGHGLGMCQEGAMQMAKRGYSYQDILNYYYQNIQLIDLEKLRFFRDE
jgi:stage II sporulation protein D